MTSANPQTIASEIGSRLYDLMILSGHYLSSTDETWLELFDECTKLQKVNVILASLMKADLYVLRGELDESLKWANNARLNGDRFRAAASNVVAYSNLGYVSLAAKEYPSLLTVKDGHISKLFTQGVSCGCFQAVLDAVDAWRKAGGNFGEEESLMKVERASDALSRLEVPEATLQAMMDEAGKILRSRRLLWVNSQPDVLVSQNDESPYLAINYRVDVSALEAADMTWELAENLSEIDLVPCGVSVGFIGCKPLEGKKQ